MNTLQGLKTAMLAMALFSMSDTGLKTGDEDYVYGWYMQSIFITGYKGPGGNVVIPGTIEGLPVTVIWDRAFAGCTNLTGVTIPDSVTYIGSYAFSDCTNLASVTVGNSVTNLAGAFSGCTSLASITIPNSVTRIGPETFADCSGLTSITIGKAVTSIDEWAFVGCTSLSSFSVPEGVTSIQHDAFTDCTGLTNFTIANTVTSLGVEVFYGCTNLTSLMIPSSVTSLDEAFYGCTSLTAILVDPLNPAYASVDGILFNKDQTRLIQCPAGKNVNNYMVPKGVTSIRDQAFYGCAYLTGVSIPDGLTRIGSYAFGDCTSLTNATLGNSVTRIDTMAFSWCSSLAGAYFRGNAPSYPADSEYPPYLLPPFYGSDNVTVYYLPGTIGWDSSYAGRPTTPWELPYPIILTTRPNFGIQTNAFGFISSWATNKPVVVEACPDLNSPTWSALSTNASTTGATYFNDPQWTNYGVRFYRVRKL